MEPQVHPVRTIKPVIQKDSIYGNRTLTQIKQQIRTEQDFVWKVLRQGYQEQPDPIPLQSTDPRSEDRDIPILGGSSKEKPNWMAEKVKLSSSFISELLAHTIESLEVPKFYHDIKKMPIEDQQDWIKACNDEMKSLADWKVWKLVDLPPGCKPISCWWVFVAKSDGHKKARLVAVKSRSSGLKSDGGSGRKVEVSYRGGPEVQRRYESGGLSKDFGIDLCVTPLLRSLSLISEGQRYRGTEESGGTKEDFEWEDGRLSWYMNWSTKAEYKGLIYCDVQIGDRM